MVLRIFYNMIVFGFILILCNSVDIVFTKSVNKCVDDPIEAQRDKADVIVTATVLKLNKGVQIDGTYSTNVQVKRVYKGNAIVSKIKSRIRGIRRYRNYNKVIQISGFGADDICESDVKEGDTKLFLVIQDSYKDLKLSSSVQKISVYNLNRINAIAKGLPFNLPPPTQSPCLGHFCAFHATCQVNASSKSPYCVCVNNCKQNWKSEVCGTDGQTYKNLCELQQSSCRQQKRLKADYDGKCNDPCDGKQCQDQQVCQLNEERKPVCKCEETCDPIVSHVCGSDGRTYSNECMLRQQACQTQRDIVVTHPGACKEPLGPCRDFHCTYDAVCQVENGFPKCRCPVCSEQLYDPVCGTNGISHKSECELKKENCEQRKSVEVEHRGLCTSNGCERNSEVCKYHSSCQREDNGIWRCVCPSNCPRTGAKVCGTDGVTYDNECELRKQGCKKQREIAVVALGDCVECNGRYCKNGAKCQRGQCVCPQECPLERNPICANDGESYRNQCEMERVSCRLGEDLRIVKSGYCDIIEGSAEGSGDLECDETTCQYGGTCQLEDDGSYRCACPFSCDAIRSPVCGSDGNSYGNKCEMHAASCQQQKLIMVQAWENCDFVEELCDGARPVYDMHTGVEFTCTGAEGCPAGSYCHLQFRRCCSEERLSDTFIRGCSESEFGCCDDHVTFASGPRKKGCPAAIKRLG